MQEILISVYTLSNFEQHLSEIFSYIYIRIIINISMGFVIVYFNIIEINFNLLISFTFIIKQNCLNLNALQMLFIHCYTFHDVPIYVEYIALKIQILQFTKATKFTKVMCDKIRFRVCSHIYIQIISCIICKDNLKIIIVINEHRLHNV